MSADVGQALQATLVEIIALSLIGKQFHWNIYGPGFRELHVQLDEFVDSWANLADEVAERAAAIGSAPDGRASAVEASGVEAVGAGSTDTATARSALCLRLEWSKLDTAWRGISIDALLDGVGTAAEYVVATSDRGYTTNLPLEDISGGKAWVVFDFDDEPLSAEHGGPARLLVPHLYFWKSAKWVRRLTLTLEDEPGFWESHGYHNYGDPWKEQRFAGD